jgi:hypothetical protein
MSILSSFRAWYDAFEACARDDKWERLDAFLTEDVTYRVCGTAFSCSLKGREIVRNGFTKSFTGFDRKFAMRTHMLTGTRVHDGGLIEAMIWGVYEAPGLPRLSFPARGFWHFEGDKVLAMLDIYEPGLVETQAALTWIEQHGPRLGGLDPSYA